MDKFQKEIAVSWGGNRGERWQLVHDKPEHAGRQDEAVRVGVYRLIGVVTVKNESRIVGPTNRKRRREK